MAGDSFWGDIWGDSVGLATELAILFNGVFVRVLSLWYCTRLLSPGISVSLCLSLSKTLKVANQSNVRDKIWLVVPK